MENIKVTKQINQTTFWIAPFDFGFCMWVAEVCFHWVGKIIPQMAQQNFASAWVNFLLSGVINHH